MSKTLKTVEFINKAAKIHGDCYDYSLVEYTRAKDKINVICKVHGNFSLTANSHLNGRGCRLCANIKIGDSLRFDTETIIKRFKELHGDRYDYSKVSYHNAHTHLEIICREHGPFMQTYANHFSGGNGCYECSVSLSPWTRTGFSDIAKGRGATLYLIKCISDCESFYKIGITTKSVEYRFRDNRLMPYDYSVEHTLTEDADVIWDLERKLHKYFKPSKYLPNISFDGRHECFSCVDLLEYTKVIEDFKINEAYYKFPPSLSS